MTQVGRTVFEVTYALSVHNLSESVPATNLQVMDDLTNAFPGVVEVSVLSIDADLLTPNRSFDGVGDDTLLTGEDGLAPGATATITLRVRVDVGSSAGPFSNQAVVTAAVRPGGAELARDVSTAGWDSDLNDNGSPSDVGEDIPTDTTFEPQRVGLSLEQTGVTIVGPTTFDIQFTLRVKNLSSSITATNLQIVDDLGAAFRGVHSLAILSLSASSLLTPATNFDGIDNIDLLSGTDSLAPDQEAVVSFTARVDVGSAEGPFPNQASARVGSELDGEVLVEDLSDDGSQPDADGDRNASEVGEDDPTIVILSAPSVLVTKTADVSEASPGDVVGYVVQVENLGAFALTALTLVDDLPGGVRLVADTAGVVRAGIDGGLGTADDEGEAIEVGGTDPVTFGPLRLGVGEIIEVRYAAQIGSGVALGRVMNTVGARLTGAPIGNEASATVEVVSDPVFERTSVIGKVWHDRDGDGWQDEGEEGLPGVRVSSVEGLTIETDPFGRYHLADVEVARAERGAQFILKVDPTTLPEGAQFTTENPRVLRLTQALMSRINFGVQLPAPTLVAAEADDGELEAPADGGVIWATEDPLVQDPRLDVLALGEAVVNADHLTAPVVFAMYTNYAAFQSSWELRIFEGADTDLVRPIATVTGDAVRFDERVTWDGAGVRLEPGSELAYVLRVTDAEGRWDETAPRRLAVVRLEMARTEAEGAEADPEADPEERMARLVYGQSTLSKQSIPVTGSRVRVHGRDLGTDATVRVDGETVPVTDDGAVLVDRQLPVGAHTLRVEVEDADGQRVTHDLPVEVQQDYRFLVGLASLTLGQQSLQGNVETLAVDDHFDEEVFVDGRLAMYAKGKIQGKYLITAQLDTTEDELRDLGDRLGDTDPRRIFRQLDPDRYYPVYGDDSTTTSDVDTQGAFYVRLDVDKNQALWGNFNSGLTDTEFQQYNRSLYGARGRHESTTTTAFGDARTEATVFASEAQSALGHNTFLATGGSLYYLKHTQIVEGSEKVYVEVRRWDTEQVVEREVLVPGRDYEVDPLQGRILLRRPLHQVVNDRGGAIIRSRPIEGDDVYLLVDYEFVPTGFLADQVTYGGRGKAWLGDHVGVGATGLTDQRDDIDYTLRGVDATVRAGQGTYVTLEYAESAAHQTDAGFVSVDGGLTFATQNLAQRGPQIEGDALGIEARVNLAEVHDTWTGDVRAWTKQRDAGFSTGRLDEGVETRDTGVEALLEPTDRVTLQGGVTELERTGLVRETVARVQGDVRVTDALTAGVEVRHEAQEVLATGTSGDATLAGVRLGYQLTPETSIYGSAQTVTASEGLVDRFASTVASGLPDRFPQVETPGLETSQDGHASEEAYANDRATLGISTQLSEAIILSLEGSTGDRGEAVVAGVDVAAGDGTHLNLAGGVGAGATSQIGASYALADGHNVYGTYAIDPDRTEGAKNTLTLGQRRDFGNRLAIFTEEQFGRGDQLASAAHVVGLDVAGANDWVISSSLQFSDVTQADQTVDRLATSVGATLHRQRLDLSTRFELRHDDGPSLESRQYLTSNAVKWQASAAHRSQAKLNLSWTDDRLSGGTLARFAEFDVGHAFRPTHTDRWNVLGRYSFLYDLSSAGQGVARPDQKSHIVAVETIHALSHRWELGGKIAVKRGDLRTERDGGTWIENGRRLITARARYHVIANWDALAEYRHLSSVGGEDARRGMLLGVYRHLADQFKVGVGYNFTDFDDDLKNEQYRSNGWFVDIIWKQ